MDTCRQCGSWSVASLATVTRRWLGETPFVQVSTTWDLTCPETVHQRPCMTREIKTWLSNSRVGNNSVVDHRSRQPVLSLYSIIVSTDIISDHIGCRDASRGGGCSKTSVYTGQFGAASMIWSILSVAALQCREGGATLLAWSVMRTLAFITVAACWTVDCSDCMRHGRWCGPLLSLL